ncbi:T9SS type A sorting domain-containing protein [bacterium]|nr:T9SS type A sorting domain-containing protein [bacterium]
MRNRIVPIILLFLTAILSLLYAQGTPVLIEEPDYTQGITNTICWGPSSLMDNPAVVAYEIQVSDSFIGEEPFFPDSTTSRYSIWPIPATSEYIDGLCYVVGLDSTESRADNPLWDGVEYCYRLRYRNASRAFSPWSNVVCSKQDNSHPLVNTMELPTWTNQAEFPISFSIVDEVCQGVAEVKLYYRECGSADWTLYPETMIVSPGVSPVDDHILFNSATSGAYCCYEFFVGAIDSLGNELLPTSGAPLWTRVDPNPPASSVLASELPAYSTDSDFIVHYSGSDVTCPSGIDTLKLAYLFHYETDPVVYAFHLWEGANNVADSFLFNSLTCRGDGEYSFFTIAVDSAGNTELFTGPDDMIAVDTKLPRMSGILSADLTTSPSRYDVEAETGWTNDMEIGINLAGETDPINGEYYASGLDSVIIAQDDMFTIGISRYDYIPGHQYLYTIPEGDGPRNIYAMVKDHAGNLSLSEHSLITLDTEAPCLDHIDLDDVHIEGTDTTDQLTVRAHIFPDDDCREYSKMFLTQNFADLLAIPEDDWQDYTESILFSFIGYAPGEWMTLWCVLKDQAGNVSEASMDSIHYLLGNKTIELVGLYDITGRSCDVDAYTCSTMIDVRLRYGRDIDSIGIWDEAAPGYVYQAVPAISSSDTIVVMRYNMTPEACIEHTIYAIGKYNHDPVPTAIESLSIILDMNNPQLPSISLRDISTGFSISDTSEIADVGWTNHRQIRVYFNDPEDACTDICALKVRSGTLDTTGSYENRILFRIPTGDGAKIVYASVKDSAGNWSSESDSIIRLDTYRPTVASVTLRDTLTLAVSSTNDPTIYVDTDAEDGVYADPAYIAIFEDETLYPTSLSLIWQPYHSRMLYTFEESTEGVKTVYVAVKDHAGNISLTAVDDIQFVSGCERMDISVFDINNHPLENRFTNARLVNVQFEVVSASPPVEYIISETEDTPTGIDDPRWNPFPDDSVANYTIEDEGEGEKCLYAWIMSDAGFICGAAEYCIILDLTPPIIYNFMVSDTTAEDFFPDVFMAHSLWSNEPYVKATFDSLSDPLSGVDSIKFEGELLDSLWQVLPYDVEDDAIIIGYEHYPNAGVPLILVEDDDAVARPVTLSGIDQAENLGTTVVTNSKITINFNLDRIAPEFYFSDIEGNSIDSVAWVNYPVVPLYINDGPGNGYLWKAYFWIEGVAETLTVDIDELWEGEGVVHVPFPFLHYFDDEARWNQLYRVHCLVVDKAGNPSQIDMLKWWLIPSTLDYELTLYDRVDTDDFEYTNDSTITAHITIESPADWMRFSETYAGINSAEWIAFSEYSTFTFSNAVNEQKELFCQLKHGIELSPIDNAFIILDTIPPTLEAVKLYDKTDNDQEWSDELEVIVVPVNPRDVSPGEVASLKMSETHDFSLNVQIDDLDGDVFYTFLEENPNPEFWPLREDGQNDMRTLYVRLLDRAENESEPLGQTILIDIEGMELVNYPNPFNPLEQSTWIRLKSKTANAHAEINIYDMFGNLVWAKEVTLDGKTDDIEWDGTNNKGTIVGNGGYICIVDVAGEEMKRKIAVWKNESEE